MENTKICSKCGRELPLSEFNKCKRSKDGLQWACKECQKQYYAEHAEEKKQYRAEHKEEIAAYKKQHYQAHIEEFAAYFKQYYQANREDILEKKQYRAEHADEIAAYFKQYRAEHAEDIASYRAEHKEEIKQKNKQYRAKHKEELKQHDAERYATIEGYAYNVRRNNLQADRKYGRCGKDEDILPPLDYYIWALQQRDFYDGKQYHWSEMGLDRIYNDKAHTFANVVPCSTKNNRRRHRIPFEEFCELIRKENEELTLDCG